MTPRVAVVGCGHWGANLVRNFSQLGALHCICDVDAAVAEAQARLYPGVRVAASLADVLADPEIDAVVLATPAARHHEQARLAILAGKQVFVEKPLALRYEDGVELVELAEAHGAVLMVGHILEYHPAVRCLQELVRSGELGTLRYIYSSRLNLGRVRKEENILWSFAPHDISVITSLVGDDPEVVTSVGGSYLQTGIADVTITSLLFADGVRAHIFVSWLHPFKEQKLVVIGDRKMAVFDDTAVAGKLRLYDRGIDWRAGVPVARHAEETVLAFDATEPLRLECEHFLACVRDRAVPLTDGVNGLRVLRVLEASQESLERGGEPVVVVASAGA